MLPEHPQAQSAGVKLPDTVILSGNHAAVLSGAQPHEPDITALTLVGGVDFKLPVPEPGAADKIFSLPESGRGALRENLENVSADAVGNKTACTAG